MAKRLADLPPCRPDERRQQLTPADPAGPTRQFESHTRLDHTFRAKLGLHSTGPEPPGLSATVLAARLLRCKTAADVEAVHSHAQTCGGRKRQVMLSGLRLLARTGRPGSRWAAACALLAIMRRDRGLPPEFYCAGASVCAADGRWQEAVGLLHHSSSSSDLSNIVMLACAKASAWAATLRVALHMRRSGLEYTHYSVTPLIMAYGHARRWAGSLRILSRMSVQALPLNYVHFSAAAAACTRATQWRAALGVTAGASRRGISADRSGLYGGVVEACGRGRMWRRGVGILAALRRKDISDSFAVSATLKAAMQEKRWREALGVFSFAGPGDGKYLALVAQAYTRGLRWAEALGLVRQYLAQVPSQQSVNTLLTSTAQSCCYAVRWVEALELLKMGSRVGSNEALVTLAVSSTTSVGNWRLSLHLLQLHPRTPKGPDLKAGALSGGALWEGCLQVLRTAPTATVHRHTLTACRRGTEWRRTLGLIPSGLRAGVPAVDLRLQAGEAYLVAGRWRRALRMVSIVSQPTCPPGAVHCAIGALRTALKWRAALRLAAARGTDISAVLSVTARTCRELRHWRSALGLLSIAERRPFITVAVLGTLRFATQWEAANRVLGAEVPQSRTPSERVQDDAALDKLQRVTPLTPAMAEACFAGGSADQRAASMLGALAEQHLAERPESMDRWIRSSRQHFRTEQNIRTVSDREHPLVGWMMAHSVPPTDPNDWTF